MVDDGVGEDVCAISLLGRGILDVGASVYVCDDNCVLGDCVCVFIVGVGVGVSVTVCTGGCVSTYAAVADSLLGN